MPDTTPNGHFTTPTEPGWYNDPKANTATRRTGTGRNGPERPGRVTDTAGE